MRDVAAHRRQLRRGEVFHRAAVSPVDTVAERVVASCRVARHEVQRVARPFVAAGVAAERQARRDVVHREALAAQGEGAVFVRRRHGDGARRAAGAAIGVAVGEVARRGRPLRRRQGVGVAVTPVDAVGGTGVRTRVADRADAQGVDAAFADRVRAGDAGRGGDVGDEDIVGTCRDPCPVFVHHIHRDGAAGIAVCVAMRDVARLRRELGRRQHRIRRAIAPTHGVLCRGVAARIEAGKVDTINTAFVDRTRATDRHRRRNIVDADGKAVAALLRAIVVHRHGGRIVVGAVGISMTDVEREHARTDRTGTGQSVTPVHDIRTAVGIGIRRIGKSDRLRE